MPEFTHFDARGNAVMVDVSEKKRTVRQAIAAGRIGMSAECFVALRRGMIQKGDVLGIARVAGIMAAKQTGSLIPLCHILPLDQAGIDFHLDDNAHTVTAICTVKTTASTGVEMEALTGVSVALLTVYDMCKAIDKGMEISDIRLLKKSGGKSGTYHNEKRGGTHE